MCHKKIYGREDLCTYVDIAYDKDNQMEIMEK